MVATQVSPVIEDFAEFLAKTAPRKLLNYKASLKSQVRLKSLLAKNKEAKLTQEENDEMAYFMLIEHLVILAKTKAIQRLNKVPF